MTKSDKKDKTDPAKQGRSTGDAGVQKRTSEKRAACNRTIGSFCRNNEPGRIFWNALGIWAFD
jgi:hypothetical protein